MVSPTNGWIRPRSPPRTIEPRVEDVDQAGQPEAEPAADLVEGIQGERRSRLGLAEDRLDLCPASAGGMAGAPEQGMRADLGLPAADRPAAAGRAVRVDRDVADLAGVAGDAGERLAVDDEPAADADLAGDEQHVVGAAGGAAADLGEGAQVGVVGHADRRGRAERPRQPLAEGHVRQPRLGAIETQPVGPPDETDDRDPDPDQRIDRRSPGAHQAGQLGQVGGDLVDRRVAPRPVDADQLEDLAAEPDEGDRQRVDGDLEGEDGGILRVGADQRRRPAGRPERRGPLLRDEVGGDELADEAADRAPGEAGPGHQLGARERAALDGARGRSRSGSPGERSRSAARPRPDPRTPEFVFLSFKCL